MNKANQVPFHRAATTGSLGFIRLLLDSSVPPNKTRLNNADRIGKTALLNIFNLNLVQETQRCILRLILPTPKLWTEDVEGVGGSEQRCAKQCVIESCGSRDP
ncbi:hypothetical protein DFH06DRAFT_1319304 [Mycena polygramma]|nr:hypothetical protein DFH06DRAFT_1341831 [Mycena polygramma]KAJ7673098.1 hypothetical protein DFH06DRAFT_1319304 [Mycena polygramma]